MAAESTAAGAAPANLNIPLVDISPLSSNDPGERRACANELLSAFSRDGFVYLSQHPIPLSTIDTVFTHSAAFFARPLAQKDSLAWTTPASNRGFVRQGVEKVSDGKTTEEVAADRASGGEDLKESMEIGRDDEPAHPNRWPDTLDPAGTEFRTVMTGFFAECKTLNRTVMRAVALALGLDETYFDAYVRVGDNTLRLLHYPPVAADVFRANPGQVRAGAHSDYGSITLLFQDQRGGLEVQKGDQWLPVTPVPGTIVVNAGDLLSIWSNGRIRSTKHRVVEPPGDKKGEHPARYSIAYFCNPDFDKWIEAIPGTYKEGEKHFEGFNAGEYLERRLGATYAWQHGMPEPNESKA